MYVEKKNFLEGIHVLRGLAAVGTVFFHLRFLNPTFDVHYLGFVEQFGAGVTLFFILSCFSLFHSTRSKLNYSNWLAGYTFRRFFRIFPLFIGMLLFYLIFHYYKYGKIYSFNEVILNFSLLYQFVPGKHESIVMAGWTIGVEVTFYCIFPFLFAISRSARFWFVLLCLAMLVSAGIPDINSKLGLENSYAYMSFPRQFFVFLLGGVIYATANKYGKPKHKIIALIISIALFMCWAFHVKGLLPVYMKFDPLFVKAWALALFVYYFYDKKFLFNKFTKFLGEASYTIYLIHPPVIVILRPYIVMIKDLGLPIDLAYLLAFGLVFVVVLLIAFGINKYFEMPVYYFGVRRAKILELRQERQM